MSPRYRVSYRGPRLVDIERARAEADDLARRVRDVAQLCETTPDEARHPVELGRMVIVDYSKASQLWVATETGTL
jgi:hypothetical protein